MTTDRVRGLALGGQRGQVLVVVALSFTVLMLFVALAVDIGFWYGERRNMQNAADAGALSGAYELCHGDPTKYEEAATSYAQRNGATTVQVRRVDVDGTPNASSGTTVVVRALTEAPTFFSRLVLPNAITVDAVAAAACGGAESGCGALPIAFDEPTYTNDIPCSEYVSESIPGYPHGYFKTYDVGSTFVVWASDNDAYRAEDLCDKCICNGPTSASDDTTLYDYITDRFTSETLFMGTRWGDIDIEDVPEFYMGGDPMGPGNRGWLRLGVDDAPLGEEAANDKGLCVEGNGDIKKDCGNILNCWIKYGFPGTISDGMCLGTLPGIGDGIATAKAHAENQIRSFVLYDPEPVHPCSTDTDFDCNEGAGGTILKVSGFGCGLVLHVFASSNKDGIAMYHNPGYECGSLCKPEGVEGYNPDCPTECPECPGKIVNDKYVQGELGIMVTRVCDCEDATGCGTSGQPTGEAQPSATSLIAVPPVTWPSLP